LKFLLSEKAPIVIYELQYFKTCNQALSFPSFNNYNPIM